MIGVDSMIFVTGDCHSEFSKLSSRYFPEQKGMTKDDLVIVCGDFGAVWNVGGVSPSEQYWLSWLDRKPFTTVFVDGNHENFDRLNNEFAVVDFHGGKAHKISRSVYHLMRGEIYDFEGKKFFAFGGAASHDIPDGILDPEDFDTPEKFKETVSKWRRQRKMFRINRVSWWAEELPGDEEIQNAERNLEKANYKVDYVISHCAPCSVVNKMFFTQMKPDKLTAYFDELAQRLSFKKWFFGHYHGNEELFGKYILLYEQVIRIE